ncbi:MAG: hypothetical protein E2O68_04190 [Deltaproteobacteria bacterium]|nr:MAG: hypothetical protein E2O68_04190 [Deltaproteobacteria bacterium]
MSCVKGNKVKLTLILFSFLLSISSTAATFEKIRVYRYSLFETEQLCKKHQESTGQWFNCFQYVEFRPDGTATLVLTDIANRATYDLDLEKRTIQVKSEGPGDMGPKMKFRLSPNKRALVEPSSYKVWELHRVTAP